MDDIIIIGGGVNGITTALTLQLLGFNTTIYAEQLVAPDTEPDPRFASLYPAASVIPHSVFSDELEAIFDISLQLFDTLADLGVPHVVTHRHYELYESPVSFPTYTQFLQNVASVQSTDDRIPSRTTDAELFGWSFDCIVAEWPGYMHQLYRWYQAEGGQIIQMGLTRDDIPLLPAEIIINCSGAGTQKLFDDPATHQYVRGHILQLKNQAPVIDSNGRIVSYNYTPETSTYSTPQGHPSDVYFYPIGNRWFFGGSRQPGTPDEQNQWQGKPYEDTITINGIAIPRPIWELNKEILQHSYGINLDRSSLDIEARIGYRYTREGTESGFRLEAKEEGEQMVIHNYGHGGAGVTLSWGCALKAARWVQNGTEGAARATEQLPLEERMKKRLRGLCH